MQDNKTRKSKLRTAFLKMSIMTMLLIVSTYAWFTSQKDITLSNLRGTVEVAENMEISLDAKTWYQEIDLSNAETVFSNAQTSKDNAVTGTAEAILPVQLLPVSGVGEIGSTLMPLYEGKAQGLKLTNIEECAETDASGIVDNGYFAFDIYIKNTSKDGADDTLQLNINSAVQVLAGSLNKTFTDTDGNNVTRVYTGDAASGLQNTVRVGLALYGKREADGSLTGITSSTATQEEILNTTKGVNITDIAIWEPNAKDHVEYIVENNNKLINETEDNKIEFTDNQEVETYALNEEAPDEGTIENIYNISSTGLGLQRTKTEKTSADDYKIKTTDNKPLNIKSIQTEADGVTQKDFKITSNTVSRLRVYVWLEGQDIDCINLASQGGGIELDLGLTKDDEVGDVGTETPNGTLAQVTNENIGEYIDLGNNIVGTAATTDDWRIFYTDGSTVYAILADYLPAEQVPAVANLDTSPTNFPYSVWSYTDRDTLLTRLTTSAYWNSFSNGISGATVTGSPTAEQLMQSYNTKNGTSLDYTTAPTLSSSTEDYDLYVPHTGELDGCSGYWLASPREGYSRFMWRVFYDGYVDNTYYSNTIYGVRPLISLPSNIPVTKEGDIWTIAE